MADRNVMCNLEGEFPVLQSQIEGEVSYCLLQKPQHTTVENELFHFIAWVRTKVVIPELYNFQRKQNKSQYYFPMTQS